MADQGGSRRRWPMKFRMVPVQIADKVAELSGAHSRQSSGGLRYKNLPRSSKLLGIAHEFIFSQQRELMGSSAQISSGVCRCGSQEQVPEEGSGRFRKVPESSGVFWCKFRRRAPEGSGGYAGVGSGGGFRKVPKGWFREVLEGSRGFRRVPARVCVGSRGRVRKVPEGSEEFRSVLV